MADHMRLIRAVLRTTFPNFGTADAKAAVDLPLNTERPWSSAPVSSAAPAAVLAMRERRAMREAVRKRSLSWDEEAKMYLQTLTPEHPMHQWAVTWLGLGEKK